MSDCVRGRIGCTEVWLFALTTYNSYKLCSHFLISATTPRNPRPHQQVQNLETYLRLRYFSTHLWTNNHLPHWIQMTPQPQFLKSPNNKPTFPPRQTSTGTSSSSKTPGTGTASIPPQNPSNTKRVSTRQISHQCRKARETTQNS